MHDNWGLKQWASSPPDCASVTVSAAIRLVDVRIAVTDARELIRPWYTEPEAQTEMLPEKLNLKLPRQPPPRIRTRRSDPADVPTPVKTPTST